MTINWKGDDRFVVKTKTKTVAIGSEVALGDMKIETPGEYESGGVQIEVKKDTIELFAEKMTVAWIKKSDVFNDDELEKLNGIDVLLIGVGGKDFCETKVAMDIIGQIDPKIVIPMYKESLESFAKEEGAKAEPQDQFKFSEGDLPTEDRKIIVLNPS